MKRRSLEPSSCWLFGILLAGCRGPGRDGRSRRRRPPRSRSSPASRSSWRNTSTSSRARGSASSPIPTGTDSRLATTVDLFRANPAVKLVALYGPEHGIRGNAQAGEYVPFYFDDAVGTCRSSASTASR